MLLPYYIAAQNIEHEYFELTGNYEPFEGLCFVDTLELAEDAQTTLPFMSEENTARVKRQQKTPITVVIGNPPYNVGQVNENDNNKNRRYKTVDSRVSETYAKDSNAKLKNKLYDPYVKFFRWASDRLEGRNGIVCYVSNNSFVDQNSFDGMRKHFFKTFTSIYHINLHGNVRQNPKLSGTSHNVFGIQVGVGITVAVSSPNHNDTHLFYHRVPENWRKEQKLAWLAKQNRLDGVEWKQLEPDARSTWMISEHADQFADFMPITAEGSAAIFRMSSNGVSSNRNEWVYDFSKEFLESKVQRMIINYNYEVFRLSQAVKRPENIDEFVNNDPTFIKWTDRLKNSLSHGHALKYEMANLRDAMFRPFVKKLVYFDHLLIHRRYQQHRIFPNKIAERENKVIWVKVGADWPMFALISNRLCDLMPQGGSQCFPFYTYDEDGTNRRENITDWALARFREHYGEDALTKWDIFHYVYAVLHHPTYREKFADNLKRELPRIPFLADFRAFAEAGRRLAELHLNYESVEPWPLHWEYTPGLPLSWRIEKMKLSKDKASLVVNPSLTLADIPPEASRYRLGNRSALEWVVDQYQVSTDKASGIKTDPNRADDEEYIVNLVGRVVRVSVETVGIVEGLPALEKEN